jgi:HD superfamily phosphohydrolase YqeK
LEEYYVCDFISWHEMFLGLPNVPREVYMSLNILHSKKTLKSLFFVSHHTGKVVCKKCIDCYKVFVNGNVADVHPLRK